MDQFAESTRDESLKGNIVLGLGCTGECKCSDEEKRTMNQLHLEKIRICDEILVLNVGGYIGEQTQYEISFAEELDKRIRYLEPLGHGIMVIYPRPILHQQPDRIRRVQMATLHGYHLKDEQGRVVAMLKPDGNWYLPQSIRTSDCWGPYDHLDIVVSG